MARPRHLSKAPITEALFDFRVKARPGLLAEALADARDQLSDRYPQIGERRGLQMALEVNRPSESSVQDLGLQGYFFRSSDDKTIAQFRVDGFTLNRLNPYTSWEELFPEALRLWGIYTRIAAPEFLTRIAVRYLNRISIPRQAGEFEEYLVAPPTVPEELPQDISKFLTRITIHDRSQGLAANISQAFDFDAMSKTPFVILDIDAFAQGEFALNGPELASMFERLRILKNNAFFGSLTDPVIESFE